MHDVFDAIQEDHRRVKDLFAQLAADGGRPDVAVELVYTLVAHETAEQELIHPLTRQADEELAEERLAEETKAESALAELEDLEIGGSQLKAKLVALRDDVVAHADHEENEEHPRLRAAVPANQLQRLAGMYELARKAAPTHPHPGGPQSATGNLVLGPMSGIADQVRDAARSAMRDG
jgi:Hemerythrin HHE cation binding domain